MVSPTRKQRRSRVPMREHPRLQGHLVYFRNTEKIRQNSCLPENAHWRGPDYSGGGVQSLCGWDIPEGAVPVSPSDVPRLQRCRATACGVQWREYELEED